MKTKEQILDWMDKQPWKGEFYEEAFINRIGEVASYDHNFICVAFDWAKTKSGTSVWLERDSEFCKWYYNDKPMSWEEYCEQNPIKEGECRINKYSQCLELDPDERFASSDANVMSEDLCKAFIAYMKLIQLRNAWVKDSEKTGCCFRILTEKDSIVRKTCMYCTGGLSFPTTAMADEFVKTFKELLEEAKPLI